LIANTLGTPSEVLAVAKTVLYFTSGHQMIRCKEEWNHIMC